jgi:hypothetical protein
VKALEERGIGRPSTYASIISTIQDRGYVELLEKRFHPTELGAIVNDQLVKHFPQILDVDFTAGVEDKLDHIAEGERGWVEVLQEFYDPFVVALQTAEETMERVKPEPKVTDEVCPNCGKPMLLRQGRFGEFLGCSGYPECKTIVNPKKEDSPPLGIAPSPAARESWRRSARGGARSSTAATATPSAPSPPGTSRPRRNAARAATPWASASSAAGSSACAAPTRSA